MAVCVLPSFLECMEKKEGLRRTSDGRDVSVAKERSRPVELRNANGMNLIRCRL